MTPTVIEDVSEILDTFNLGEITDLLKKQVSLSGDNPVSKMPDYFKPLYYKYLSIMDSEDNPQDIKDMATERFTEISTAFINIICERFELEIDQEWKDDNSTQLPGVATALYCFFVQDIVSNITEVCLSYIRQNKNEIFQVFEERKNKKDAATMVNKRKMEIEMAVIAANIYDVTSWILSQLTEEQFLHYTNQEYIPLRVVRGFLTEGILSGNFANVISDIYEENPGIKAEVCYQLFNCF